MRQAYPKALILFRAAAGFAVPALCDYLEEKKIRQGIGVITNNFAFCASKMAGKGPINPFTNKAG